MIFRTVFQGKVGLVVGMVRRSRLMFAFLGSTTLDPLASSSQAPRSSSLQAFEPSSFQAIKPSSFQAFKLSLRAFDLVGLIGIAKTKTSWKSGMGCKQTAYTHILHPYRKRKIVKVTAGQHTSQLSISSSSVQPSKHLISIYIQTDLCTPTMPAT
jgi:hypothetical protein